jgi:hypothetical protein
MAAETPFGASFGDPRRYMGQSPLAEAGKAAKTFLTGYALKQSGLEDYLNSLGKKQPQGAVAPSAPTATAIQPPQANFAPVMPVAPQAPAAQGVVVTPILDEQEMPQDIGEQILNGTWTGFPPTPTGPTSLKNPTDFNPLAPDTSNQFAVSGNDYMNAPGYGKLQKIAGQFMGMG